MNQSASSDPHQHFAARRDAQFVVNILDMIAHRVIAETDFFSDFPGGVTLVNQRGNFQFAIGQAGSIQLIEDFPNFVSNA